MKNLDNNTAICKAESMEKETKEETTQQTWIYLSIAMVFVVFIGYVFTNNDIKNIIPNKQAEKATIPAPTVMQTSNKTLNKTTKLTIIPSNAKGTYRKPVGEIISFDIIVSPGNNKLSFLKFELLYDPTKLEPVGKSSLAFTKAFPSILEGPTYTDGKILATVSSGVDPTNAIDASVTVATIKFKTLATTAQDTPTTIQFGPNSQALSIAAQDESSENVIGSTEKTAVYIIE